MSDTRSDQSIEWNAWVEIFFGIELPKRRAVWHTLRAAFHKKERRQIKLWQLNGQGKAFGQEFNRINNVFKTIFDENEHLLHKYKKIIDSDLFLAEDTFNEFEDSVLNFIFKNPELLAFFKNELTNPDSFWIPLALVYEKYSKECANAEMRRKERNAIIIAEANANAPPLSKNLKSSTSSVILVLNNISQSDNSNTLSEHPVSSEAYNKLKLSKHKGVPLAEIYNTVLSVQTKQIQEKFIREDSNPICVKSFDFDVTSVGRGFITKMVAKFNHNIIFHEEDIFISNSFVSSTALLILREIQRQADLPKCSVDTYLVADTFPVFLILYAQMHKVASENYNRQIIFELYCLRKPRMSACVNFFDTFDYLIPANVVLKIHLYDKLKKNDPVTRRGLSGNIIDFDYATNLQISANSFQDSDADSFFDAWSYNDVKFEKERVYDLSAVCPNEDEIKKKRESTRINLVADECPPLQKMLTNNRP